MTHECEKCKSDEMQDLVVGRDEIFYCRSCWKPVDDKDVHPKILRERKWKKYRGER